MENIGVSMDGSQVVAVKDLGLDYNVFELITKGLSVDSIRLDQPVIYLRRDGDTWSLSRLVKKQAAGSRSVRARQKPIAIDDDRHQRRLGRRRRPVGTSGVDVPKRFDHLDAKLSFKYEPVRYSIEITHVSFRGSDPAIALNALSGGVAGARRHGLRRQAGAADRGNVAVDRRRGAALPDEAGVQAADLVRQAVGAGDRAARPGAGRHPAAAGVRDQGSTARSTGSAST